MRFAHALGAGSGIVLALVLSLPLARGQQKSGTISVDEIKDGMKGYGLTVFQGTEPERFDVEAIGVLHNFRPGQDLILVKTPHPRLNITKNVKGMSGSPIFFDGRLAGAYAYSLSSFQVEPVAGVTPIAPMLVELARPIPPGFWPLQGTPPLPSGTTPQKRTDLNAPTHFDGAPGGYDVQTHAKQLADRFGTPSGNLIPVATPLLVAGVSDHTLAALTPLFTPLGLEPLQGGGGAATPPPNAPQHFVDGGSLGVQLARGDVSFFGLGTVTHVEGTKLCGFGHPMMNGGDSALPAALGRVLWIYANGNHSFKVGESLKPLGALVQDRQSAVVVDETKIPPMFPVKIDIVGAVGNSKKTWSMEVADERFMSASLSATVLGSAIEASISERRDVTWTLKSVVKIKNHGTLELDDFGIAIGGMPDAGELFSSRLIRAIGDIVNNPWEQVRIEGVQATLSIEYTRDVWRLRGVDVLDPVVNGGEKARFVLHLRPFAGPEIVRTVEAVMPTELAGKEVEVEIVPGYDIIPESGAPESLEQLLANTRKASYRPKSVVVQIKLPSQGVTFGAHVAPRLPGFALDALRTATSDVSPDPFTSYSRTQVNVDQYVDGRDKVKVKVLPNVR